MVQLHFVKKNQGFVTLMAVIIIGSAALTLTSLLYINSIWAIKNSGDEINSINAKKAADACIEVALQSIHDSSSFTGSSNLTLASSSCSYTVSNLGGSIRQIYATGTAGSVYRKASTTVSFISPKILISDFEELP